MKQRYTLPFLLSWCLLLGLALGSSPAARAQSGPYGNEWITPGQSYYKIRITRDGLYRLNYNYLTQAGLGSAAPGQLQMWRRGKEVAIYVGGTSTTALDASSFVEFFGQRNDGKLDVGMYKNPQDHYQKLYSLYTDTASYFLTVAPSTASPKRMVEVNPEPVGGAHPHWRNLRTFLRAALPGDQYNNVENSLVYQPWGEAAEGFFSSIYGTNRSGKRPIDGSQGPVLPLGIDSLQFDVKTGPLDQIEVQVVGVSKAEHKVTLTVLQPSTGVHRPMGPPVVFNNYEQRTLSYPVLRTDIKSNGVAQFYLEIDTLGSSATSGQARKFIRIGYTKYYYVRPSQWNAKRTAVRFYNDSTLGSSPAYYSLDNVPATVRGYDVTDPYNVQRVEGRSESGTRRGYVFPNALPGGNQHDLWLVDAAKILAPALPAQRVEFAAISPASYNFLIVTSSVLSQPVDGVNPVQSYATYRASAAGGSYQPLVVTSEQLYDQFHYGEKSALAIRDFVQYMLTNSRPKSLLLLGKGLQTGEITQLKGGNNPVFVYHRQNPEQFRVFNPGTNQQTGPVVRDLVPTSTRGASDIFFTSDWPHNDYAAKMATGRISAQTPQDVASYLEKLQEYERVNSLPDAPDLAWRKNALDLVGGENPSEYEQFGIYMDQYKKQIERPFFAGKVVRTYARTDAGLPQELSIANELNAGLAMINYFGHGSPTALDFVLGNPELPNSGYNNTGKYPVMFATGCAAGNSFQAADALYPEDWLLVPKKGLIGFMSESSFGFAAESHTVQLNLFNLLLNDPQWYGKPIAEVQNEVARRLMPATPGILQSTLMSTVWHSDPALRLFSPEKPDFAFGAPALEIQPIGGGPLLATSPSFRLLVKVRNPAKVTYDKLDISVRRKFDKAGQPDAEFFFPGLRQALHDTTYVLTLPNTDSPAGTSTFTVVLDYQNHVAELDEQNNTATTTFTFLQPGITLLNPPPFAIMKANNLRLVGQTNVDRGTRPFEVELDTVPTFNSALVQRTTISAPLVAYWRPHLPVLAGQDSVVWYWRMRFQTQLDPDENLEWTASSFRVINTGPGGWSQSHYGQFRQDDLQRLDVAVPSGKWSFPELSQAIGLRTQGAKLDSVTFKLNYGLQLGTDQLSVLSCGVRLPNILVSVIDGGSLKSVHDVDGGPYESCGTEPNPYYHFAVSATDNINSATRQQQLLKLLTNIPNGAHVALISVNRVKFSTFSPELKAAITALGSQKVGQLQDGDPFVLLGQKGAGSATAQEATYDPALPGLRTRQVVSLSATLTTQGGSGALTSTLIGPAQEWTTLYHTIRKEASDSYTLRLIGVDANKAETVLQADVTDHAYGLSGVSATQYPYLKLQVVLRDTLNRTAPQLEQLLVTYQGLPEGVARPDSVLAKTPKAYDAATLLAQAAGGYLKVPVVFTNVTPIAFGTPLKARIRVRSTGGSTTAERITEMVLPNVGANGAVQFDATADVRDLSGDISMQVDLNMDKDGARLPELFYFNNQLTLPSFQLTSNNLPPVLDVAFDGEHILNGDIVKPSPIITVLMTSSNRLRPISPDNAFDVVLIRPDGTQTKVDLLRDTNISFRADSVKGTARLEYEPGKGAALPDGIYRLEVQGRDATNTQATAGEKFVVSFEVINASSITHIFPYPNPITSKARFVFTLTGSEVPRNMKIQIMTLTGKVVKEIMMEDIKQAGDIRIGSNITDYAWDGTDTYGDRLANGTYLYRVVMDDPQRQFERRKTTGDKAFKNEWGKLVLLH